MMPSSSRISGRKLSSLTLRPVRGIQATREFPGAPIWGKLDSTADIVSVLYVGIIYYQDINLVQKANRLGDIKISKVALREVGQTDVVLMKRKRAGDRTKKAPT
uniref:hypothetical protein n=1 Tax=Citrobacter freundii TaxID=546 RepID=UPI0020B2588F|nr:hypothetical protein [Citrobacter freundii]